MIEISGSNASTHAVGQSNSATRIFITEWDMRLTEAEGLLGATHPDIPHCVCRTVRIEPLASDAPMPYAKAKITAEYVTDFASQPWPFPKPQIREGTTLSIGSIQVSGEFMRIPARGTRWYDNTEGDPNKPMPEGDSPAGRYLVGKADIVLHWDNVDNPPLTEWVWLKGTVNGEDFLGCEPETLLFLGYELEASTKASIENPFTWRLTPKFSHRVVRGEAAFGWNHEYRPDGWTRVKMYDADWDSWTDRYRVESFANMFL